VSDDLHYHRIRNLIKGLTTRTDDEKSIGRLKWEAVGTDTYELSLARSSLRISSEDPDGPWYPYVFTLLDENGTQIEEIRASSERYDGYGLKDLFTAASRSHSGVSEKLTEVFRELGIADPPPADPDPWGSLPKSGSFGGDDQPPF
jgi:hypothetical protein